jgi:Sulfotransferase family
MKAVTREQELPEDSPSKPPDGTIRVLYIGGWGRSGSTLLDLILGQAPGVFSAGEVREIWQRGLVENRPCGCERPFRECPFWQAVGEAAFGGWDRIPLPEILRLRYSLDRPWSFPALPLSRVMNSIGTRIQAYTGTLQRLYAAIAEVSGATVIVDSSNLPSHAFLLRAMPGIDLRVIHLVRDSRAVAFSWRKHVEKARSGGPPAALPRYDPGSSSLRWLYYNGLTQTLRQLQVPYTFVRYEDLMDAPRVQAGRLLRHAGLTGNAAEPSYIVGQRVRLEGNHTAEGNPMRFVTGELELRADQAWRRQMPSRDRRVVTALTLPLLSAYGYPLNGQTTS